jgi:hypothetical protein
MCRSVLKGTWKVAFVLPRGIFAGDQHRKFRENSYRIGIGYSMLFDLEKNQHQRVSPLFNVESCVLFGQKGQTTTYPLETRLMEGRLPSKNTSLKIVHDLIQSGKFKVTKHDSMLKKIGRRSSWNYDEYAEINRFRSPYSTNFRQGSTIIPNPCWFVELNEHSKFFAIDEDLPEVQTSQRSHQNAHPPYEDVYIQGIVEKEYLYATLLGSDVLPFCNLRYRIVVLPVNTSGGKYQIITKDVTLSNGHDNMFEWLRKAEGVWKEAHKNKPTNMTIYQRLNRNNGITGQKVKTYAVLYNSAGRGNLASCVINLASPLYIETKDVKIALSGFIAEHKTYVYYTENREEANYISAVLNSNTVFPFLKKIKSARDIEKKIWDLPIPYFDSSNDTHMNLSILGNECAIKAPSILKQEISYLDDLKNLQGGTIGMLRKNIKSKLQSLEQIDQMVSKLLTT